MDEITLITFREYVMAPLTSTFVRLQQADSAMIAGGIAGAAGAYFAPDAFFWLFLLLLGTNGLDWLLGRHAAHANGRYDRRKSRNGLVGKGAQLGIMLVIRSLEAILAATGLPSTMGIASSAIVALLVVEDVESIERHGIALGGRPIPGLSALLNRVRSFTGSPPSDRREEDSGTPPPAIGERRRDRKVSNG